jgi:PAS domain S-box-containing protein
MESHVTTGTTALAIYRREKTSRQSNKWPPGSGRRWMTDTVHEFGLKQKITLSISILVIFLISTVGFVTLSFFEGQLKETISQYQSVLVAGLACQIDKTLTVANNQLIAAADKIPPAALRDPDSAQAFLDGMIGLRDIFDNKVAILTLEGKIFAETPFIPARRGLDLSYRSYYTNTVATETTCISDPYISSLAEGHPVVMMTAPIFDKNGILVGILSGAMDLMGVNVLKDIAQTVVGRTGYLYLTTRESRMMIMHPDTEKILKTIPPGTNHLYDKAVEGFEGTGETVNSSGVPMLTSFKRLQANRWILAANYPVSEAHEIIFNVEKKFFIAATAGIVGVLITVFILIKYLTSPLTLLTRHIEALPGKVGTDKLFNIRTRDEIGTLSRAFNRMIDALDRQSEELQKSEERYRTIYDSVNDAILIQDIDTGAFVDVNKRMCEMYGCSKEEAYQINVESLCSNEPLYAFQDALGWISKATKGEPQLFDWKAKVDGRVFWVEVKMRTVKIDSLDRLLITASDITDRKRAEAEKALLEDRLRQAQKMEAIGTLAGGIAHDFNNILTALIGYGSLLQFKMATDDPLRTYADEILKSSEMAANLTLNLLAFTRQQVTELKAHDINAVIQGIGTLLQRLLSEDIELKTVLTDDDVTIMSDIGQIDQVLLNLVVNARDAMPNGGKLVVATERMTFDDSFVKAHGFGKPGEYVLLSASDTGIGMDEKTKERIFEPFFTTKQMGKGTGLGLSTVWGVVKQHDGFVTVYSEPGEGTTFHIYFPLAATKVEGVQLSHAIQAKGGTETILIAEDHSDSRRLIKEVLDSNGYTVIETVDGVDAVQKYMDSPQKISLLILDVVMPKKNGMEIYAEIKKLCPEIKVLFMSGYTGDIVLDKGIQEKEFNFICKPLSPNTLLLKIREILDKKL